MQATQELAPALRLRDPSLFGLVSYTVRGWCAVGKLRHSCPRTKLRRAWGPDPLAVPWDLRTSDSLCDALCPQPVLNIPVRPKDSSAVIFGRCRAGTQWGTFQKAVAGRWALDNPQGRKITRFPIRGWLCLDLDQGMRLGCSPTSGVVPSTWCQLEQPLGCSNSCSVSQEPLLKHGVLIMQCVPLTHPHTLGSVPFYQLPIGWGRPCSCTLCVGAGEAGFSGWAVSAHFIQP